MTEGKVPEPVDVEGKVFDITPDKPKKRAATICKYRNTSRDNVFTTKGRVAPGGSVRLAVKEATQYGGKLEKF